ncbi:MAG: disulfide bond formation protein DsbA [Gammaproteobacteria bacterium SG8_15]|nr:MAG: disulfide bond formation protein DsbA [Gammaproteobacteria bacterium SG8_15]
MNKQMQVPIIGALILIVFAIAVLVYNEKKTDELTETANKNASLLIRDYSPTTGDAGAKVTIVEFFDPACETCKAFHPFVKQIMAANPGRIKLVLRYLPLHKGSDYVAKLLEAARLQNKFWETLEVIYQTQSEWASHHNPQPEKLWSLLRGSGLDLSKAREDMISSTIAKRVQQDLSDARQLQVNKTPGFFVNGKPLVRFGSEQLLQLVNEEIRNNY